ncbi:MAG: Crp/Fnr family transcriptional regulator [Gammaproteobacteria bacterium]|jgi:CRP/FNR family transcriptional regulator
MGQPDSQRSDCLTCPVRPISLFAELTLDELGKLKMQLTTRHLDQGMALYHEGDPADAAYTLIQGVIKLSMSLPDGQEQIVRLLRPGDLFGVEGLVDSHYHHSATPLGDDVAVCQLDLKELSELTQERERIRKALIRRWARNISHAERRLVELRNLKANRRLWKFLEEWCAEDPEGWTYFPLSRQHVADYLGLTVETVSRLFADWKRRGNVLEQKQHIRLKGPDPNV